MQRFVFSCLYLVFALTAGCVPVQVQPPASPVPPSVSPQRKAGPYWHQEYGVTGLAEALTYYTELKELTADELIQEHQRLLDASEDSGNRIAKVQLVLFSCLPEQQLVDLKQAAQIVEDARQDTDFHPELGNLFVLIYDQLASLSVAKSQGQEYAQSLVVTQKKVRDQGRELASCREQRNEIAGKLQQLQDIERGLLEREQNK